MSDHQEVTGVRDSKVAGSQKPLEWTEAEAFIIGHVCGRITRSKVKEKTLYSVQVGKMRKNEGEEPKPFYSKTFFRPNDLGSLQELLKSMRFWIDADMDENMSKTGTVRNRG